MKTLKLGKSSLLISPIVMGAWQAGKKYWVGVQDDDIISAIHAALESGVTAFDTAEEYGEGYSERLLAKALGKKRKDVVLMSKVFSNHLEYGEVFEACERSLKNLKTDTLDLYQIHWPSGSFGSKSVPLVETMRALIDLKEQGKIRAIGVSNFSLTQLKEAEKWGGIDSLQPPYSLFWRHIEKELAPYCRENQITLLAYSPLAQGFLTGKFSLGHRFKRGDNRAGNKLFTVGVFEQVIQCVDALKEFAERKNVTLAEAALAWVIDHPNTAAIAGARNAAQITDSAKAMGLTFSGEEFRHMEAVTWPVARQFLGDPFPWVWGGD